MARETKRNRDYSHLLATIKNSTQLSGEKKQSDSRYWQLSRDKDGNGFAIIRFLPDKNSKSLPFRPVFKHAVTINEKLFIQKCPSTIHTEGVPSDVCPICAWNQNQSSEFVMENATYRKKSYISNILIIKDPLNPDNEGKIFLFEFGPQIYKILREKLFPSFAGEEPLIFFDPDKGANFKIKIKKDGQFPTWAASEFSTPSIIEKDIDNFDMTWENVEEKLYDLKEIIESASYRTFEELQKYWTKYLESVGINNGDVEKSDISTPKKKEIAKEYAAKKESALKDMKTAKDSDENEDEKVDNESEDDEYSDYFNDLKK